MKFFLGAHGTGKSTLLEEVKKIRPEYLTTEGLSRPLYRALDKYRIPLEDQYRQAILNEMTAHFYKNLTQASNVLCTRSIIDVIVYTELLYPQLDTTAYREIWDQTKDSIEAILYLPIQFPLVTDEIRKDVWSDPDIQRKIQERMVEFVESNYTGKLVMVTGTVEQRMEILKSCL